jgi:hypothetical protein
MTQLVRLSRRQAARLSLTLQGNGGVLQVVMVSARCGVRGRTARKGINGEDDPLAVGFGGWSGISVESSGRWWQGNFGRHDVAWHMVATGGEAWSVVPPPLPPSPRWCLLRRAAYSAAQRAMSPMAALSFERRGRAGLAAPLSKVVVGGSFGSRQSSRC